MTQQDLYAICMESETAQAHVREICAVFGVQFSPDGTDDNVIELELNEEVAA